MFMSTKVTRVSKEAKTTIWEPHLAISKPLPKSRSMNLAGLDVKYLPLSGKLFERDVYNEVSLRSTKPPANLTRNWKDMNWYSQGFLAQKYDPKSVLGR